MTAEFILYTLYSVAAGGILTLAIYVASDHISHWND